MAVLLIAVLAVVNYLGVRWGALVQNLFTVIKTAAIIILVGTVFIFAKGSIQNFTVGSGGAVQGGFIGTFGVALVAALWAFKGWEVSTFSAGEVKNPERNLPLGIFAGTAAVILLYLAANLAYLYVFPVGEIAKSTRIASDAMNAAVGTAGATFIAIAILFSITGACNGHLMTGAAGLFRHVPRRRLFPQRGPRPPEVPDAARLDHRRHLMGVDPVRLRDLRTALHLCRFRAVDLLRPDRHGRLHPAPEAAGPSPALPDLGLSRHAGPVRPGRAGHFRELPDQHVLELVRRVGDHGPRPSGLLFWRRASRKRGLEAGNSAPAGAEK